MSPAESSISPAPGPVVSLRHGTYEDAQALFSGTLFVAMALMLFNQAGLLIGSTAGMAFLLHYVTDISFGKLFFVVNLPFYWFAWTRMGREFTLKTFVSVALLSLLTELFPHVMQVSYINPLFASLLGGLLLGTGCLFLARHRSSLGGRHHRVAVHAKPLWRARGQGATGDRLRGAAAGPVCGAARAGVLFGAGGRGDGRVFMDQPPAGAVRGRLTLLP